MKQHLDVKIVDQSSGQFGGRLVRPAVESNAPCNCDPATCNCDYACNGCTVGTEKKGKIATLRLG